MPVALHLAPHPDDEVLGAGATLLALRDAGWDVVAHACSLGRPEQVARRRAELREACRRAGFALRLPGYPPARLDAGAEAAVAEDAARALAEVAPALLVAPHPHDAHHGHEVVGRAALRAVAARPARARPRLWLWSLWGPPALPTLYVPVPADRLARAEHALRAHAGELARADYVRLLRARAATAAIAGAEQVLGWGSAATGAEHAELLTEVLTDRGPGWPLAAPRVLDAADALAPAAARGPDAGAWLHGPSPRAALLGDLA